MKLQDKFLYMSFGAGLVVLGIVLNSLIEVVWRMQHLELLLVEIL